MQHHTVPSYMTDIPYQPIWNSEAPPPPPPPMIPYQNFMAAFPSSEFGKFYRPPEPLKDLYLFQKFLLFQLCGNVPMLAA